ncbi:MAG: peptide-methionine (R)-S-oxide reductase, partial [Terriglobales bacterium]
MLNRRQFLGSSFLAIAGGSLLACSESPVLQVAQANSSDDKGPVTVIQFSDSGERIGPAQVQKVHKTDAEWKKQLTAVQFDVTRHQGTEMAFSGEYYNLH